MGWYGEVQYSIIMLSVSREADVGLCVDGGNEIVYRYCGRVRHHCRTNHRRGHGGETLW